MVARSHKQRHAGFTYLGLLFFIAIMGITLALAATLWSFAQQREKERELLFVGGQFRRAIGLYYERTPGTVKRYPHSLEEVLQDNRYVTTQRYLRRIYTDPISQNKEWGLIPAPDGGVMGVYSKSEEKTIKTGNFRFEDKLLEGQKTYSAWQFAYLPQSSNSVRR